MMGVTRMLGAWVRLGSLGSACAPGCARMRQDGPGCPTPL